MSVFLSSITDVSDAKSRMTEVVRWFLLSVSASRKVSACVCVCVPQILFMVCFFQGVEPKKPYNPVLGETFHCYWDLPIEEHISDTHQYQVTCVPCKLTGCSACNRYSVRYVKYSYGYNLMKCCTYVK